MDGVLAAKLGLAVSDERALDLGSRYLELMRWAHADFTAAWRALIPAAQGNEAAVAAMFRGGDEAPGCPEPPGRWLAAWRAAGGGVNVPAMRHANPAYIPRNHQVERVLQAATTDGDFEPLRRMLAVVTSPREERETDAEFAKPAPPGFTAGYRTFCGT